jgi:hypothetical protein
MRRDTRQRKHAMTGLRAIAGQDRMLGTMVRVISSGKQALDAVMLEMGRMVQRKRGQATFPCASVPASRTLRTPCLVFHADKWPGTPTIF